QLRLHLLCMRGGASGCPTYVYAPPSDIVQRRTARPHQPPTPTTTITHHPFNRWRAPFIPPSSSAYPRHTPFRHLRYPDDDQRLFARKKSGRPTGSRIMFHQCIAGCAVRKRIPPRHQASGVTAGTRRDNSRTRNRIGGEN